MNLFDIDNPDEGAQQFGMAIIGMKHQAYLDEQAYWVNECEERQESTGVLVRYEGSLVEYRGFAFTAWPDQHFEGRFALVGHVSLNNVRLQSFVIVDHRDPEVIDALLGHP